MLTNNQSEKHPQAKLKIATVRTSIKVSEFFEKMSNKEKNIDIVELLGKKAVWGS